MFWAIRSILEVIVALPILAALSIIPQREGRRGKPFLSTGAVGLSFVLSLVAFGATIIQGPERGALLGIDRLGGIMLVLVTGVSTIVHVFATRYMDSDPRYARFFGWLGAVTACVVLVVSANNLMLLAVGWIGVGLGLYRLQTHFCERPAALAAARTMREAHAVGDLAIVIACAALALATHETRIDLALAKVADLSRPEIFVVAAAFAIAAISKSAQIPFHGWLPETMEAPTPVSALMHAGIVNAGGFLLTRFSPIFVHAWPVASVVFVIGAATALWGASCMLVRSDVKRGLAYSTVSQMGFMTMQCGLGAFPAAILHLVAHGIFKATLFLGSGYAVRERRRELARSAIVERGGANRTWAAAAALVVAGTSVSVALSPLGRALPAYGWFSLAFAAFTTAQMTFAIARRGNVAALASATILAIVTLPTYAFLVGAFDRFLAADIVANTVLVPGPLAVAIVSLFGGALLLGWGIVRFPSGLYDRVYVWLLNEKLPLGFVR